MSTRKSLVAGWLVGLVTASLTITAPAQASPPIADPDGSAPQPADASRSVTLITGDRVTVTDAGGVAVHPGEGRGQITFVSHRTDQSTYVIPSDALPLLADGRLDQKLFDVALLRESGYHDERDDLPLIITEDDAPARPVVTEAGAEVTRALPVVDGLAARVEKDEAASFWGALTAAAAAETTMADEVSTVWLDALVEPLLDQSVPQVGAPAAWEAGLDGSGVTVAVLDSGVDAEHPDLADRLIGQRNFTEDEDDRDRVGHGTHVASIAVGTGAASDGRYRGVAPGADLLDGKVCSLNDCATSWVLAGMEWAAEQGAAVVNMSLGWPDNPPLEEAVATLTDQYGTLFVVSAGNAGADASVLAPARADAALAVGAVDRDDALADFSSRGPGLDGALKPDLTAPGVEIAAARSQHGSFGAPGQPYVPASGTSMASPHVAGAAAILAQQHPDWSPAQLKAALTGSAVPNPELSVTDQGAGRLDVARAVTQPVVHEPASVSFARQQWPHDDDAPQSRVVTYHNHGDAELTLELAVTATGPDGVPAPDGMFEIEPATVTVPAGGSAEVTLTSDTTVADVDGYFGGYLTATGPGTAVTTAFGVDREVESYDVTLSHLDRSGEPAANHYTLVQSLEQSRFVVAMSDPEVTLRLPAGEYLLGSELLEPQDGGQVDATMLLWPRMEVTEDLSVTLDARDAEPVSLGVPDPAAVPVLTLADALLSTDDVFAAFTVAAFRSGRLFTGQIGPPEPLPGLGTTVHGVRAVPGGDGGVEASRTVYNQAYFVDDEFVTGFERTAKRRELARVRTIYAAQLDGSDAVRGAIPIRFSPPAGGIGPGVPVAAPLTRTEFYNTGGAVEWIGTLEESRDNEQVIFLDSEPTSYQPGGRYRERWNYPVFGPVLALGSGVMREGDELVIVADLYGDGAGHHGSAPAGVTITVFRDGEQIAEVPSDVAFVEVPPEPAAYRVEVEAQRQGSAPLSRQTSLAWEFESERAGQGPLPVSVVRFSPNLAPDNTAPAGGRFLVPVRVDPAPGSDAGAVPNPSIEVSYDDGQTWREARLLGGRFVVVPHPAEPGFVSLRATATDPEGNTVEQTIIRAYAFG